MVLQLNACEYPVLELVVKITECVFSLSGAASRCRVEYDRSCEHGFQLDFCPCIEDCIESLAQLVQVGDWLATRAEPFSNMIWEEDKAIIILTTAVSHDPIDEILISDQINPV